MSVQEYPAMITLHTGAVIHQSVMGFINAKESLPGYR